MDRPLHGGPVSPWTRRARRLGHWCVGTLSTLVLAALVAIVALVCADALGAMVVSIALLVSFVLLYALSGLAPLTLALVCALTVVAVSHYWLGLDLLVVLAAVFDPIAY